MRRAYYNENDQYAAQWLRNLIGAGLIAPGDVDNRSILEVRPGDLDGYAQCHFFAGIGGWSYALRRAGWPDDRPVWTGSCPCQPFSLAGQRKGVDDERHLWPEFNRLIAERRPPTILGEQVAGPDGRKWLAGVRSDLEAMGYAVGAADLCAASVGAPHIRQRLFWVADAERDTGEPWRRCRLSGGLADLQGAGLGRSAERKAGDERAAVERGGCDGGLGDPASDGREPRRPKPDRWGTGRAMLHCLDGRTRRIPVEPRFQPLAHGVPARVGRLRAYGNAIVPQVAVEFIRASREALTDVS